MSYLGGGQSEPTQIGPGASGSTPALASNVLGIASQKTAAGDTTYYTRDEAGGLLSQRTPDNQNYYYLTDGQGSVTALTDANGDVVDSYSYDPYGQTTSSIENVPNSFGYAQGFNIGGLIHYNARYYNPTTGRWTQPDPLDQTGNLTQGNRYSYVGGNPINLVDLAGTSILDSALGAFKGCVEGAVKGPEVPGGTYIIKVGTKIFSKTVPAGRVAGCAEGAVKSFVPGL